ncbi:MAG: Mov34/MPN/PAD-1 family protein [Candidatus Bathyarchaeia archaeon]
MRVELSRSLLNGMLSYSAEIHPREAILLLRGRIHENVLIVEELLIPPFAVQGWGFASFQPHALPLDLTVQGVFHSHPSGSVKPSPADLNHFYGIVLLIACHPYRESDIAAYDREGERLNLRITS